MMNWEGISKGSKVQPNYCNTEDVEVESLIGEKILYVDVSDDCILLSTESGRQIWITHMQDCCEQVCEESVEGDWFSLKGKVVEDASCVEDSQGDPQPEYPDSWTWTTITFKTDEDTIVSKWLGESNGYYSESVDFREYINEQ